MYKRFAGEAEPEDANAAAIAGKIREHLHEREYRIHPGRPDKGRGRITARAASIVQSAPPHLPDEGRCWPPQDEKDYEKAGNVAADIRARAENLEKEARGRNRFSVRDAAPVLYEQYGRLFRDGNGKALRVPEARKEYPGMFALHCAVKDAYARILENHRPVEEGRRKSVARVLPADMGTLFRLVEAKAKNRDLNALVRMGKLIHYQSAPSPGQDAPGNVVDDWRPDVTHSRYRTSEGQSEIKRTEAFVRVWRNTIALAARTLKDWADPQNDKDIRDVLGNNEIRKATGERFDASAYAAKLPLLFGDRKDLFESEDEAFGKSVLRLALNGWAKLRHSSLHFKGLGEFARILDLYIEMHDAKFEGGEGMAGAQALKGLFEPEGTFDRVYPTQTDEDRRRYVPWRGLREILRFGCLAPLMPVFEKYSVKADNVDKLDEWEKAEDGVSRIAGRQAERERLHDRWAKKRGFPGGTRPTIAKRSPTWSSIGISPPISGSTTTPACTTC